MTLLKYVLILMVLICSVNIHGQIYICVDEKGQRHYSDKRCPPKKQKQTASINEKGKEIAPQNVQIFTSAIQLLKRSYALLTIHEPGNLEYSELYNVITRAELKHTRFLTNPISARYRNYNPFTDDIQSRVISNISEACRHGGYFSICATIEGNPWISEQELAYYKEEFKNKYAQDSQTQQFCDKAIDARSGGVISDKMMTYFCRSNVN